MLGGEPGEPGERGDHALADQRQRRQDLELLDVLGQVAGGHPLVDVLVPGERAELLDARLHVVAGDPLARGDAGQVDLVDDLLVGLDDAVRHVDAEVPLGLEHRDPELPLEDDLVLGRPDLGEVGAGVAGGEDVGVDDADSCGDVGAVVGAVEADQLDACVGLARASATSAPTAVTARTRPPAVTSSPRR